MSSPAQDEKEDDMNSPLSSASKYSYWCDNQEQSCPSDITNMQRPRAFWHPQ